MQLEFMRVHRNQAKQKSQYEYSSKRAIRCHGVGHVHEYLLGSKMIVFGHSRL